MTHKVQLITSEAFEEAFTTHRESRLHLNGKSCENLCESNEKNEKFVKKYAFCGGGWGGIFFFSLLSSSVRFFLSLYFSTQFIIFTVKSAKTRSQRKIPLHRYLIAFR